MTRLICIRGHLPRNLPCNGHYTIYTTRTRNPVQNRNFGILGSTQSTNLHRHPTIINTVNFRKFSTLGRPITYEEDEDDEYEYEEDYEEEYEEEYEEIKAVTHDSEPALTETEHQQSLVAKENTVKDQATTLANESLVNVVSNNEHMTQMQTLTTQALTEAVSSEILQQQVKWNIKLNQFIQRKQFLEANQYFEDAMKAKFPLNLVNYNTVVKCLAKLNRVDKVLELLKTVKQVCKPDAVTYNTIIAMYGKQNKLAKMKQYYDLMLKDDIKPTLSTFTTMISSYHKNKLINEPLALFNQMSDFGVRPNKQLCTLIIQILAQHGKFEHLEAVVSFFTTQGWKLEITALFAIIDAYSQHNDVQNCIKYFDMRHDVGVQADVGLWTKFLTTLIYSNKPISEFRNYYQLARHEHIAMDSIAYTAILRALLKRNEMEEFRSVVRDMQSNRVWWTVPLSDVYMQGCLRSGDLAELLKTLKQMQQFHLEPDFNTLRNMAESGMQSLKGEEFAQFVRLYTSVAATYLRYLTRTSEDNNGNNNSNSGNNIYNNTNTLNYKNHKKITQSNHAHFPSHNSVGATHKTHNSNNIHNTKQATQIL